MGMKHSGKSSLGRRLARLWKAPFLDLDDLMLDLYQAQETAEAISSARQIYKNEGLAGFQLWEQKAANQAQELMKKEPGILALGGGTIENLQAMKDLETVGTFVYLEEEASVLFQRIMAGGLPAFLTSESPWEDFQKLFTKRTAAMKAAAKITVPVMGKTLEEALTLFTSIFKEN